MSSIARGDTFSTLSLPDFESRFITKAWGWQLNTPVLLVSKILMFHPPSNLRNLTADAGSVLFIFRSFDENEPEAALHAVLS